MGSRLGQHFLKESGYLKRITDSLEINSADTVIEIGPGHGELTEYLIKANSGKIIVIEADHELAASLKEKYGGVLEVIEGDALKIIPTLSNKLKTNRQYSLLHNRQVTKNDWRPGNPTGAHRLNNSKRSG